VRENAASKARRLLLEGRVRTTNASDDGYVSAEVRGDSARVYTVRYDRDGWVCGCPALGVCSHIKAVQLVVVVEPRERRVRAA
jgi:uncharacterized Zn finger protein